MTDDLRKIGRDGHPSHRLYRTQENVESRNLSLCIHTHLNNPSHFNETVLHISSMTEFNVRHCNGYLLNNGHHFLQSTTPY